MNKKEVVVALVFTLIVLLVYGIYGCAIAELSDCRQCLKLCELQSSIESKKQVIREQAFVYETFGTVDLKAFIGNQMLLKQDLLTAIELLNELSEDNHCEKDIVLLKIEYKKLESEISSGVHYYQGVL